MPEGDDPSQAAMDPRDAIERMERVTQQTGGLRVRTEGLTLVIWAICMAASYLTIAVPFGGGGRGDGRPPPGNFTGNLSGFDPAHGPPSTMFFASQFAPLVWFAVAVVVTIAIWRSASLSFQTGMSTPRLVATFVGWLLVFVVTSVLLTFGVGGPPQSWHLVAWGVVMGTFAGLNPLRFSNKARLAVALGAVVALSAAADAYLEHLGPRDSSFLSGLAIGVPGLLLGLYLILTG